MERSEESPLNYNSDVDESDSCYGEVMSHACNRWYCAELFPVREQSLLNDGVQVLH